MRVTLCENATGALYIDNKKYSQMQRDQTNITM